MEPVREPAFCAHGPGCRPGHPFDNMGATVSPGRKDDRVWEYVHVFFGHHRRILEFCTNMVILLYYTVLELFFEEV